MTTSRLASLVLVGLLGLLGCSSSSDEGSSPGGGAGGGGGGSNGALPPGDHFFDGAATTTGKSQGSSFRVGLVLFDPAGAAHHPAGTAGSNPARHEAAAALLWPDGKKASLSGDWQPDGSASLTGEGWTFTGKVAGSVITGSFQSTAASGVFAGADLMAGKVGVFFGTQGLLSFDVVVSGSGAVTGVIGGTSGGFLTGTASGGSFSYSWEANNFSGSGSGSVDAGGHLSGMGEVSNCQESEWICQAWNTPGSCNCACSGSCGPLADHPLCKGLTCCLKSNPSEGGGADITSCACVTDAYLASQNIDCATFQAHSNGWMPAESCPLPSSGSGSSCKPTWKADPAPPSPWAQDPCNTATIPGGNCTWGGSDPCACPASFGCAPCGACCLP